MTIEEALRKSHCADWKRSGACAGVIVIKEGVTILACAACGNEKQCHNESGKARTPQHVHDRRKQFYATVLSEIQQSIERQ